MNRFFSIAILVATVISANTHAQIYEWATFFGGNISTRYSCLAPDGSIYMTGDFEGTISHGDFSVNNDCGGTDVFLTKLNNQGEVQWLNLLCAGNYNGARSIATDNDGNIYLVVDTQGNNITLTGGFVIPFSGSGVFLIKLDSNGNYVWHSIIPGIEHITIANNSIYCSMSGSEIRRVSLADGSLVDSFVTSNVRMLKSVATADGRIAAVVEIPSTTVMPDGYTLYNSGMGIEINIFGQNPNDFGIVCLDTALNYLWAEQFCSSWNQPVITADDLGNIYTSVEINYGATIEDSIITAPTSGTRKTLIRLTPEGTISWIKYYDSTTNGPKTALGTSDGVIYAGDNYQTITFSDGNSYSTGSQDAMMFGVNADGSLRFIDFIGRTVNSANISSLAKDSLGNIYAAATLTNTSFYIGCDYYENQPARATVLKFQEGNRSAPTPVIANSGGLLTATPEFNGTITWYLQGNDTPLGEGSAFVPTQLGFYYVTYTNSYNCSATSSTIAITQLDQEAPIITCSSNADVFAGELCTGLAEIVVTATDGSGVASFTNSFNDQGANVIAEFPLGSTIITFTAADGFGNASNCEVAVNVMDVDAPTISCPSAVDAETLTGDIELTIGEAVAADNCGAVSVTNSFSASADAAGTYPVGTTTVIYTAIDDSGNANSCETTVTVTATSSVVEQYSTTLNVWPNPATNNITLNLSKPWFGRIVLRSPDGKTVQEWNNHQSVNHVIQLSLSAIPSGIYLLELQGNESLRSKIIVQ